MSRGFRDADDGSGLVHLAPAFGADDFAAAQALGLAMLRPWRPTALSSGHRGRARRQARHRRPDHELIIRRLKDLGRHWKTDQHGHSYPHCWRCRSKLIYYAATPGSCAPRPQDDWSS